MFNVAQFRENLSCSNVRAPRVRWWGEDEMAFRRVIFWEGRGGRAEMSVFIPLVAPSLALAWPEWET